MRLRLRAAILVFAVFAAPALAQEPPPLGLERALLVGDFNMDPDITVDLGGDGITDLVVVGSGLLNGTERIPAGTRGALQSIVRGTDGRWRHTQSFSPPPGLSVAEYFAKGDVDGDGFDDVVFSTIALGDPGHYEWRQGIELLRQYPPGELHRAGAAELDSVSPSILDIHILGNGTGRVLIVRRIPTENGPPAIQGAMMQWSAAAGWTELWSADPDSLVNAYHWDPGDAAILGANDPLLISRADRSYGNGPYWGVATPIRSDGWGPSIQFRLPHNGRFQELERNGERQVWFWSDSQPDSLYQVLRTPEGDSVLARTIPIGGLTEDFDLDPVDAVVTPSGDAYFLASGRNRQMILVRLSPEGSARLVSQWAGLSMTPRGLLVAPDGSVEVLWKGSGKILVVPSRTREPSPPSVPMRIVRVEATADFDGDELIDLLVVGVVGDTEAEWLLQGIDRPPWFRPPEPVSSLQEPGADYEGCLHADLDGDGRQDLIQLFSRRLSDDPGVGSVAMVCRFWDGWRFRHDAASDVVLTDPYRWLPGDFDGDGRDEIVVETNRYGIPVQIVLRWNRDRTSAPLIGIENPIFHLSGLWRAGDVNGDGREEMVGAGSRSFSLWKLDPATGDAVSLGSWANGQGFTGGGLADLTGDGCVDLYWFGWIESWIWSINKTGPVSFTRTGVPFVPYGDSFDAADLDADGHADLVGDGYAGYIEVIADPLGSPRMSIWVLPERLEAVETLSHPIVWTDVDRDGDPDLVVLCRDGIRVHRNETLQRIETGRAQSMVRTIGRNPARGEAEVAVHADCEGEIVLDLFDVTGRRIWRDQRNASAEGWFDFSIRPRVGRAVVPSGVYFLRVEVSGRVETQRIVLGF